MIFFMILDYLYKHRQAVVQNRRSHAISLYKAISWRVVGTLDTILISYLITGKWNFAISIGAVEVFTKIMLFYLHDRTWEYFKIRNNHKEE